MEMGLAKSGKERVETEGEEWEASFPFCFSLWLPSFQRTEELFFFFIFGGKKEGEVSFSLFGCLGWREGEFRKFWFELVSEGDLAFGRTRELYLFCFSSLFLCGLMPFLSRLMKYVCNGILYIPLSMKICSKEMITFSSFTFSW